jgi:DNA-directed RNA polymerase subunit RPC12/RpoP
MLMKEPQNMLLCDACDRDPEPTGQIADDTRPQSGPRCSPEARPVSAPPGTSAGGGGDDVVARATHCRTSADAAAAVIVRCVHCRARLGWAGRRSGRVRCPKCRKRLIVRSTGPGNWAVLSESDDSVAGMVCDWLGPRSSNKDADS